MPDVAVHQNSSYSSLDTSIPAPNLSPVQALVIASLAQGLTVSAAARHAGIHRTTIHHWRRNDPEFTAAVQNAQQEYTSALNDQMRDLAATALKTLHTLLEAPGTPDFVRLKTALAVLERPHYPEPGWHLPERVESHQKQESLDSLAQIKVTYQAMRMAEGIETHARRIGPGQEFPE